MKHLLHTPLLVAALAIGPAALAQQSQQGQQQATQQGQQQGQQAQQQGQQGQQAQGQQLAQEQSAGEGPVLHVSPATVRQVQQKLNKEGFGVASVDGSWNQETEKAARNFQQARGMEPTGKLTVELLAGLDMAQVLRGDEPAASKEDQQLTQEASQKAGAQLYASPALVRQIQQALNTKGYDVGSVQGEWNQNTQKALRNFQQAQGMEPTGQLNERSLAALNTGQYLQQVIRGGGAASPTAAGGQAKQADQQLAQEKSAGAGTPIHLSPSTVRQIEQSLNSKGYHAGNVDGKWDQETQKAVRNFQQAKNLEPTGSVNIRLIKELELGQVLASLSGSSQQQGQGQQSGQQGQEGQQSGQQGQSQQGQQSGATAGQQSGQQSGATAGQQSGQQER